VIAEKAILSSSVFELYISALSKWRANSVSFEFLLSGDYKAPILLVTTYVLSISEYSGKRLNNDSFVPLETQ
jgi:hypothetical protein